MQIERAVVRLEAAWQWPTAAAASKPTTLTAETFYEEIAKAGAGLPSRLKAFIADLVPLGVMAEIKRTLSEVWRSSDAALLFRPRRARSARPCSG